MLRFTEYFHRLQLAVRQSTQCQPYTFTASVGLSIVQLEVTVTVPSTRPPWTMPLLCISTLKLLASHLHRLSQAPLQHPDVLVPTFTQLRQTLPPFFNTATFIAKASTTVARSHFHSP